MNRHLTIAELAVRDYLAMADRLMIEAARQNAARRPVSAGTIREWARIARSAARGEELDPEPEGLA